jgi:hypothetical protein
MIAEPAGLGAVAPARLGRADRRVHRNTDTDCRRARAGPRARNSPARIADGLPPPRAPTSGSPKAPRSASSADSVSERRRLGSRSTTSSTSGSIQRLHPRLRAWRSAPDLSPKRKVDGGNVYVLYLEGSDQHRGWFHSSLLESCGTRGHAPPTTPSSPTASPWPRTAARCRSRSATQVVPAGRHQAVRRRHPAPLGGCPADYADDQRIGPEILKTTADTYRKLRNTLRWMLGTLAHDHRLRRCRTPTCRSSSG